MELDSTPEFEFRIFPAAILPPLLTRPLALPLAPALAQSQPASQTATAPDSAAYQQFVFAYRLLQRNEDKLATDAFDEFLQHYPQDERRGDAIYYRALLASRAGENEAAAKLLADCPRPCSCPPNDVPLLHAQVYCDLGKFDPALAVLEKINAAAADPATRASILYLTGVAYRGSGNLPGRGPEASMPPERIDSPLQGPRPARGSPPRRPDGQARRRRVSDPASA